MADLIDVNKIHFYLVCPNCGANIGTQGKHSNMRKNCRCLAGEFFIHITARRGNVLVKATFKYTNGTEVDAIVENVTVGED
jgi:hypothetical protein